MSVKQGNSGRLSYCSETVNNIPSIPFPSSSSNLSAFINVLGSFGFVNREKGRVLLERGWSKGEGPAGGQNGSWSSSNLLSWLWAPLGKEVRDFVWLGLKTELHWGQNDQVGPRVGEEASVHISAHHCKKQWLWEQPEEAPLVWALASHNWRWHWHFCRQ